MIPKRNNQLKKGLDDMCLYLKPRGIKTVLEIGCWAGSGSKIFANHFDLVTCVDPWEPTDNTISARHDMKEVEYEFDKIKEKYNNIIKIKKRIEDYKFDYFDLIYIDAEHTYEAVSRQIKQCYDKCLIISGHDYWPKKFPGVVKAVNELLGLPDKIFCDTSWLKEIK